MTGAVIFGKAVRVGLSDEQVYREEASHTKVWEGKKHAACNFIQDFLAQWFNLDYLFV